MRVVSALLLPGAAILASAQHHAELGYIQEVCLPLNDSKLPDMNAPCNALQAVQLECIYGPETGLALFYSNFNGSYDGSLDDAPTQSNRTQQVCACESQLFDLLNGCDACGRGHGSRELNAFIGPDVVASISTQYCTATASPTLDLANFFYRFSDPSALPAAARASYSAAQTSSFSDHIGNTTAVSYYFTPSVTGSAAWSIVEETGTAGASGTGTFASVVTSAGQIVATATPGASTASGTARSTSSPNAGARETAAVMGVMGLMGVVAML